MRSGISSKRSRMAVSVTALVGLSAASGCAPRAVSDGDRVQRPVAAPQPDAAPQPAPLPQPTIAQPSPNTSVPGPNDQFVTTFAIGEEEGGGLTPVQTNSGIGGVPNQTPYDPLAPTPIGEVAGEYERIYIPAE